MMVVTLLSARITLGITEASTSLNPFLAGGGPGPNHDIVVFHRSPFLLGPFDMMVTTPILTFPRNGERYCTLPREGGELE